MNNQFLNHLNSITPQGRAKDTSIFVPAKDINEAVPDVGQNIRGMPKKAGRKFAQALHNLAQDRGSLENYQAARERYTKKKASNAQRQGRNLDRAVQSFKKRMRMDEATSKGDPKRGHFGRAIPKVMPGEDPYDKYTRGEIKNFSGKLQKRLNAMSPEGRRSYYQRMGMRSRAASRGGKTQRLFPMTEAPKYAQDAIPAVPELLMLTYSNKHKRDADGLKKFVGKSKKNPMPVYEGAVKASMEDWLSDLPKGAIRELKAKHGKHLAQTGMGGKDPKGLDSSVHGILQKHNVPPLMGSHRNSVDAVKMSFHTFHGDLHEQKEVDDEGGMAMGELKSIIANANDIMSMLKSDSQLEGWVQSKITKSADYISSVKDYLSNTPNSISEEEEKRESTKSMIARLVARGHKKIGKPIPKNVLRDIEKEHKNEDDDYEDD
jgi:3-methyladenine DNA glycosylase Tag